MSLTSIITNSQNGSFDLLATEYKNPPGLANTSGEAIRIAITATGQWCLLKPDFATNDPTLVKYKTPVDSDGHARDQNDQKYNFKYPTLNPAALVAEIKDAQGNTKSTVSGKQQSFELQPGDTVSFIINDDPKWYGDNVGKLTIGYSTIRTTVDPLKLTPKGRIVVNSDEWPLSDPGFQRSPDAAKFAINVAKYFVGEGKGKFHALSNNFGLVGSSLEQTMTQAGHTWTKGTNITIDLPTLSKYDGIFLAGHAVDNQVLIQYVKNGGKVYLAAGVSSNPKAEADSWNTFLGEFGLKFAEYHDNTGGNLSPNQSHPLLDGVKSLYFHCGNSIIDLKPESPLNQIIQTHTGGQGLIATAEFDPTAPVVIADLYNTGVDDARKVLGDSVADSHYTLATCPGGTATVNQGNVARAVTTPNKDLAPINWVANTQTARWIGPNTASATGPVGDYSYKTTFTLPSFSEALIVGELSVDDWITDILINGVSVGNPVPLSSWTNIRKFSISKGFVVGTNTIEFKLHSVGGPTGLRIDSISGTYRPSVLKATVYQHGDFQGISKELLPGSYGIGDFGLPNDTLSSLKVDKGLKVTLYEHGNATGRSKTFTSDAAWVGDDFNDITSNIKVELLTAPIVVTVPPANAPTIPQGFHSPFTFTPSAAPVIQWNGYTYWAYSYTDNRMSMAIVAYDAKGQIVKQWEKPGARYLTSITVDSTRETVTLIGQANQTTVLSWSELRL